MNDSSPCFNSGCTNAQNNNQTYNCCPQKNLLIMWMIHQTGWDWFCTGNRTSSTQQLKHVGNTGVFCFGFYFMITLLLQVYSCLLLVQVIYRFLRIGPEILIEISLVLVAHGNENPFHHVLVCVFVI